MSSSRCYNNNFFNQLHLLLLHVNLPLKLGLRIYHYLWPCFLKEKKREREKERKRKGKREKSGERKHEKERENQEDIEIT